MVTEDENQTRCASSGDDSATIGSSFSPTLTDASSTPTDSTFITAPSPPPDLFTDMSKRKQRYCQVNLAVSPPGYNNLSQYSPYCPLTPLSPEFPSPAAFLRYPSNSEIDGVQQKSQRHSVISSSKHRGFFPPYAYDTQQQVPQSPGSRLPTSHPRSPPQPSLKTSLSTTHLYLQTQHHHKNHRLPETNRCDEPLAPAATPTPSSSIRPYSNHQLNNHTYNFSKDAAAARRSLQSVVAASEMNFSMDRRPSVCSDSQDEGGGFSVDDAIEMYLDGFSDDPSPETEDHDHEMTDTADDRTDVSDQKSVQEPETEGFEVPEDWPLPNTYEEHSIIESLPNVHSFPDNTIMEDTVTNEFGAEKRRSYKPLASNPVLLNTEEVVHPNLAKRYSSVLAQKPCERLELPPNFPSTQPPPLTRGTSTRDRYGFHKSSTSGVSSRAYDAWNQTYTPYLEARRKKWDEILENSGFSTDAPFTFPPKSRQMKRFIRKGIPPEYRGHAWFFYAGGDKIYHQNPGLYRRLVEEAWNSAMNDDKEHIERDLHRTFPDNIHFKPDFVETPDEHVDGSDGQKIYEQSHLEPRIIQSLRRVLYAFALHNSKIGYTQSLNFIAGMLLLLLPEEKAFWMLHIITSRYLPATHEINLEGADVDLWILMVLLREQMPAVYAKIADTSPSTNRSKPPVMEESADLPVITLGLTNWLMSIFIGSLPWETTLRVWDIFFYEGSRTFFRVGLGIFKSCEKAILSVSDSSEIFQIVQKAPKRLLDANALIDECFVKKHHRISQQRVESLRNSRRRGLRAKKQRLSKLGSARNCGASDDYRPKTGHAWRSLRSHAFRS